MPDFPELLAQIRSCTLCAEHLPLGPRPVLQASASARVLVVGQAPGRKVHETGIPFNDPSGERLRDWLGMPRDVFYDPTQVALVPMGFCFPGTGRAGDLPPRPECAATWRPALLSHLQQVQLTVVLGQYALGYHLPPPATSVTERVQAWRQHAPQLFPLPHPSPRNNRWLKNNPWFEAELLPALRLQVRQVLGNPGVNQRRLP
ncbi:MAG: uracil-DNA glycosylase family protein [Rhodoferax sp.]|nr:uracil-DNA glycosylase family protein [Rhodoferax sp.]